jgi:DNA mismatch repair protein MutL
VDEEQDQEELGTQIIVEGSKFVSKTWHWQRKTSFQYSARFFKSDTVEYRHIIDEFQRVV